MWWRGCGGRRLVSVPLSHQAQWWDSWRCKCPVVLCYLNFMAHRWAFQEFIWWGIGIRSHRMGQFSNSPSHLSLAELGLGNAIALLSQPCACSLQEFGACSVLSRRATHLNFTSLATHSSSVVLKLTIIYSSAADAARSYWRCSPHSFNPKLASPSWCDCAKYITFRRSLWQIAQVYQNTSPLVGLSLCSGESPD